MKACLKLIAIIIMLTSLSNAGFAQIKAAKVTELAFMAGTWTQHHKWGDMEEYWGRPMGDNMVSSFRNVKDGKVTFYEFVVIEQTGDIPVMKMRHFNRGSIAWEEKDKPYLLLLVKLEKNLAGFESLDKKVRLVYKRADPEKMDVVLEEKGKDDKWQKDVFNYTLKH